MLLLVGIVSFAGMPYSVLMPIFRLLQGLAVGGEYTGSAVFLAETAHPDRRGFAAAWAPFGAVGGMRARKIGEPRLRWRER